MCELNDEEIKIMYCWQKFTVFANEEGISLNDRCDWGPWWDCWVAAIDAVKEREGN